MMEKRNCWPLLFCLVAMTDLGLLSYMHFQNELLKPLRDEVDFTAADLSNVQQGLHNFHLELEHVRREALEAEEEVVDLQQEMDQLTTAKDKMETELKDCRDSVEGVKNDMAAAQKEKSDTDGAVAEQRSRWSEEASSVRQRLERASLLCGYVREEHAADVQQFCPPSRNHSTPAQVPLDPTRR